VNSSHEDDPKRYLVWNEIGKITSRVDNKTTTIKVEFTNTEKYKNIVCDSDTVTFVLII
jgi:hypothetical protein